ncbi:MAG: hypothetical protein HQ547_00695, partial [Candidatus Omnitrophica bacterium]|nr:hypothetical protein [Candidatus Omnitrophota bacterium]
LSPHTRALITSLQQIPSVSEELSQDRVNADRLKEAIIKALSELGEEPDYRAIFKEITRQSMANSKAAPTRKQANASLDKLIALSLIIQPTLRGRLNAISEGESITPALLFTLKEVLSEIKPEAEQKIRDIINEVSGYNELSKIVEKRVKSEKGDDLMELDLIPAKTRLDFFYGYFGENCTDENPEELLNPAFTPIRIVHKGKIVGCVHTLTLDIEGKKSLVICGIEPQTPLANALDAEGFVIKLLEALTLEVATQNGYEQVLVSTSDATRSNRDNISEAIKKLIKHKSDVHQEVQSTFPSNTSYSIADLKLWAPISDSATPVESRQAQTVEALAAAGGRGVPIRALVVVEGVSDKELKDLEDKLNEGLYRNGFGTTQPGSRRGRSTHELLLVSGKKEHENELAFEGRLKREIHMARGYLPEGVKNKDRIVTVFAPLSVSDAIRSYTSENHGSKVNVINDAYSDSNVNEANRLYPDAMIRYAIARQIFASTISEPLRGRALETISNLLQKITENSITIDTIEKLFTTDFILRIKPINWNQEIGKWQKSQKATATAL